MKTIKEWSIAYEDHPIEPERVSTDQNIEPSELCASVENPCGSVSNAPISKVAKFIHCDNCGKLFKIQEDVAFHATKSGNNIVFKYCIIQNMQIQWLLINITSSKIQTCASLGCLNEFRRFVILCLALILIPNLMLSRYYMTTLNIYKNGNKYLVFSNIWRS